MEESKLNEWVSAAVTLLACNLVVLWIFGVFPTWVFASIIVVATGGFLLYYARQESIKLRELTNTWDD